MKKASLIILSTMLCLNLIACGSSDTKNTPNEDNTDSSNAVNSESKSSNTVNKVDNSDSSNNSDTIENKNEATFSQVNLGDSITTDFVEMTVEKAETAQELHPTDTSSVYSYMPDENGETYFYLFGAIKNISGDSYDVEDMNIVMTFDGKYNYTGYIAADDGGNDFYGNYVKPLVSVKYYMYASVPDELISSYSTCTVKFGFHENFDHDYETDFNGYEYCYSIDLTK